MYKIHNAEGHKNEPLKIFYTKFPGHDKGSVFWNYETKTFTKHLLVSDFATLADRPQQTEKLFVPIGQNGLEHRSEYL
ncbi:MAG: hypothetical protein AAF333_11835 [Planctomycetota bacterium]